MIIEKFNAHIIIDKGLPYFKMKSLQLYKSTIRNTRIKKIFGKMVLMHTLNTTQSSFLVISVGGGEQNVPGKRYFFKAL